MSLVEFVAHDEGKEQPGETAGLLTVPSFPLPPYPEPVEIEDTGGRFPMQEISKLLKESDDTASDYWFARVLPKEGDPNGRVDYLMLRTVGKLILRRQFPTVSARYIIATPCGDPERIEKST